MDPMSSLSASPEAEATRKAALVVGNGEKFVSSCPSSSGKKRSQAQQKEEFSLPPLLESLNNVVCKKKHKTTPVGSTEHTTSPEGITATPELSTRSNTALSSSSFPFRTPIPAVPCASTTTTHPNGFVRPQLGTTTQPPLLPKRVSDVFPQEQQAYSFQRCSGNHAHQDKLQSGKDRDADDEPFFLLAPQDLEPGFTDPSLFFCDEQGDNEDQQDRFAQQDAYQQETEGDDQELIAILQQHKRRKNRGLDCYSHQDEDDAFWQRQEEQREEEESIAAGTTATTQNRRRTTQGRGGGVLGFCLQPRISSAGLQPPHDDTVLLCRSFSSDEENYSTTTAPTAATS